MGDGANGPACGTVQVIDTVANKVINGPPLNMARWGASAVVAENGDIIVLGGTSNGRQVSDAATAMHAACAHADADDGAVVWLGGC